MNQFITPAIESKYDHSDIHIQVFKNSDKSPVEVVEFEEPVLTENAKVTMAKKLVVYIDYPGNIEDLNSLNDDTLLEFEYLLKLHVNKDEPLLKELQYAMDIKIFPEVEEDDDDDDDDDEIDIDSAIAFEEDEDEDEYDSNSNSSEIENQMQAQFTRRSGCYDDMRAHGKKGDDGVPIKIQVPSSIFRDVATTTKLCSNDEDVDEQEHEYAVDVVAGWACNHGTVTLTHSIEFRPRVKATCSSNEEL